MSRYINVSAGKLAYVKIKEAGLNPDDVRMMTGAAGGPKWLILGHLDRALFSSWFQHRTEPLFLIGSSSGAWRFASVSQKDPVAAIDRFEEAYIRQQYASTPTPEAVSEEGKRIQDHLLGPTGIREILTHPYLRLNVVAVRCKRLSTQDHRGMLIPGMAVIALCNAIHRRSLKIFFERVLFYDSREVLPIAEGIDGFPIQKIPLTPDNLKPALLASGSIPLVMSGVTHIPQAAPGTYRDGGVIDYHIDIPFHIGDGVILFPHYTNRIVPGWLDKRLFWRKPQFTDATVMVSPSVELLQRLPYQKIPDRTDFKRFQGNDAERMRYWKLAADRGKWMADEFMELVESGNIREQIQKLGESTS